jgi:hypothetical protein
MDNPKPIEWSIKGIKELEFFVNESLEAGPMIDTSYTINIDPSLTDDKIQMSIAFSFLKNETKELLMKSSVMTVYLIRDLKSFAKKVDGVDSVNLPDPVWHILFSIAFTHTRAIMARSSAGSKYSHLIMPPVNPEVEFKKLFGKILEAQQKTE